jgi:hypothetical protein
LQDGDVVYIGKHSLTFAYFQSEIRPEDNEQVEIEKTMAIDTNEYRSMPNQNDSQPETGDQLQSKQPANSKKKLVRGYVTYMAGGEGTLALKKKVTKIGKDASNDIVIKGWKIGKTAATISRTRDGYYFSYMNGLAKPKINDKKTSNKPIKLNELDIIQIGPIKLQFIGKKPKRQKAT